jgi:predicted metalloprotease with PDZ domain
VEPAVNNYQVKPINPEAHLLSVRISIPTPDSAGQKLYLPAWIRGSYMVRDFARNIVTISASSDGLPVALNKLDKQTWQAEPVKGSLEINYQVYAWDLSVRAAHVDTTHAYFNGPSLFLAVEGQESESCELAVDPPDGEAYADWRLVTAMPEVTTDEQGFGTFAAENYEALLDYPMEMGQLIEAEFSVDDKPHRFMISGRCSTDLERICSDLALICAEQVKMFGELPVQEYLFMLWVVGDGYGGLEHRNSTSLMISRRDLPAKTIQKLSKGYRKLLGLCSHEYFHLWNVKRITPEVFLEQGMQEEVYTRQLWVFEGITSYYDDLMLLRSGVIKRKDYFELVAETATRVMRGSGRYKQTLEESSFDAWTKFYKQDENAPNAIVSYYAKGALFALLLDLEIRLRSQQRYSLDDVMRLAWQRYGSTGIGLPEAGFEPMITEVTGEDFSDLLDLALRSTAELPLQETLRQFGVELHLQPAKSASDNGGVLSEQLKAKTAKPVLGAKWQEKDGRLILRQVDDHGAAQKAGLSAGDEILALDGLRMNASDMERTIAECEAGSSIEIHVFRRDELMLFELTPQPAPLDTCYFYLPDELDDIYLERREAWLRGNGR